MPGMADSDDDLDRHRGRDKFRRERSDYENRRRPGDKREPFDDKSGTFGHMRTDHRINDLQAVGNDRGRSPATDAPPFKRSRREDDFRNNASKRRDRKGSGTFDDESIYRPPLMPFKRFLEPMDDLISEEEACGKYKEYKETYSKRHIEEFFEAHKGEEWLRFRYHPDFMPNRKSVIESCLKHRLNVFMELYKKGFFDNQSVQMDNSENLIRLMDSVVIKLEGGSDDDLKVLDACDQTKEVSDLESTKRKISVSSSEVSRHDGDPKSEEGEAESDLDGDESEKDEAVEITNTNRSSLSRRSVSSHRSPSKDSLRSSRSGSVHSSDDAVSARAAPDYGDGISVTEASQPNDDEANAPDADEDNDVPTPTTAENPEGSGHEKLSPLDSADSIPKCAEPLTETPTVSETKGSWPLHKTASIFFRAIPPTVAEAELRELCASQPGFLRLAMWDPVPERRFMRHAWATYNPTVNIKKICWALNTSPLLREKATLQNGELGATVNRDLAQRVRPLTPLTRHKPVMHHDLRLAAQLVARLDNAHNLWKADQESSLVELSDTEHNNGTLEDNQNHMNSAISSNNPLLKSVTEYLVEKDGSEEEALTAESNQNEPNDGGDGHSARSTPVVLEYDPSLARALDHLILYLRVVHSVDFYAGSSYPNEDSMPHRCGILHARGDRGLYPTVPGGRVAGLVFSQREIKDHLRNFELKLKGLLDSPNELTEEEMKKLGMRDPEKVMDDFVEANIQKRTGKKKPFKVVWVCPLSDKKFREPIFVRKHIFNKHMDKVEAAKKDNAIFFNNYLRDPRRPCLPEAPYNVSQQYFGSSNTGGYRGNRPTGRGPGGGNYRGNYRGSNPSNSLLSLSNANYGRGGGFQDYYDAAAQQQQQQQAMAAVAAAAAAALYPNTSTAADLYALAAGGGHRNAPGPMRRGRRGISPKESRPYHDGRRRQNAPGFGGDQRRPFRGAERNMVSYNDLDDPNNDGA